MMGAQNLAKITEMKPNPHINEETYLWLALGISQVTERGTNRRLNMH